MRTLKTFLQTTFLLVILLSMLGVAHETAFAASGPCDIYASGSTPCVAAHSTTRALFGAYSGRLYQVRRAADGARTNVGTLSAGGFANAATQPSTCGGTSGVITRINNQPSTFNHHTPAPAAGA